MIRPVLAVLVATLLYAEAEAQTYDDQPLRFAVQESLIDIAPDGILSVETVPDPYFPDRLQISLQLGPEATSWLAASTGVNIGYDMQVYLCGDLFTEPRIQEQISGGGVLLSGVDVPAADVHRLVAILRGDSACSASSK